MALSAQLAHPEPELPLLVDINVLVLEEYDTPVRHQLRKVLDEFVRVGRGQEVAELNRRGWERSPDVQCLIDRFVCLERALERVGCSNHCEDTAVGRLWACL